MPRGTARAVLLGAASSGGTGTGSLAPGSAFFVYGQTVVPVSRSGATFTPGASARHSSQAYSGQGRWAPDGSALALTLPSSGASPLYFYTRSGNTIAFRNAAAANSLTAHHVAWSPDSKYLAVSSNSDGRVAFYTPDGTYVSSLTVAGAFRSAWSPDGTLFLVGTNNGSAGYLKLYAASGLTFTALTAPSVSPAGAVSDIAWSPDGQTVIVCSSAGSDPYVKAYQRSGNTLTNVTYAAGSPLYAACAEFSPDSTLVAIGYQSGGNNLVIAQRTITGGTASFSVLAQPSVAAAPYALGWSSDGQYLATNNAQNPQLYVFQRSGSTFTQVFSSTADVGTQPNMLAWYPGA